MHILVVIITFLDLMPSALAKDVAHCVMKTQQLRGISMQDTDGKCLVSWDGGQQRAWDMAIFHGRFNGQPLFSVKLKDKWFVFYEKEGQRYEWVRDPHVLDSQAYYGAGHDGKALAVFGSIESTPYDDVTIIGETNGQILFRGKYCNEWFNISLGVKEEPRPYNKRRAANAQCAAHPIVGKLFSAKTSSVREPTEPYTYAWGWPTESYRQGIELTYGGLRNDESLNTGLDIICSGLDKIYAVDEGIVQYAERKWNEYSYTVEIDHENGTVTRYANFSKLYVQSGQRVKKGRALGQCGATGRSSRSYLHFEVMVNGEFRDPNQYIF
ncbi:M23 family metallopeptidase [Patescibacteria group bacterium]|nr:M23 family metallopeptidase [Patescibacteria group bacterium]